MVFINKVGHFVLFGGKPKNCEILESFGDNPDNFDRVDI